MSGEDALESARGRLAAAREACQKARAAGALWDAPEAYQALGRLLPTGIYEHFKHTEAAPKRYALLGVSFDVETMAPASVYAPLYGAHYGTLMSRPLFAEPEGFLVPVEREGYSGPRFCLVREAPLAELVRILTGRDKGSTM